ncbi:hypothetical protein, partial [Staphylococcus capitis]|uniref:hypothetical protein n=1 Tax=Staphylococcus capitis TaxID=29388 RepID=UPI001C92C6E4
EFHNHQSSHTQHTNLPYPTPNPTTPTPSLKPLSTLPLNPSQPQQQPKNLNHSIKLTSLNTHKHYLQPNNPQPFSPHLSFQLHAKLH